MSVSSRRPRVVASIAVGVVLWATGCAETGGLPAGAGESLAAMLGGLPADAEVLAYRADRDENSEFWLVRSRASLRVSGRAARAVGDGSFSFPAGAVTRLAVPLGVPPESVGTPRRPEGRCVEWGNGIDSYRLREVETDRGFVTAVERMKVGG